MAHRVDVRAVDDIDGEIAAESVRFHLDGVDYEIDLSERNARALRDALAPYLVGGRRIDRDEGEPRVAQAVRARRVVEGEPTPALVREWAKDMGWAVPARGRVPGEVWQAFVAAHS